MVKLNLEDLLLKNGRSRYWLVTQLESNYTISNRIIHVETTAISFSTIDKLLRLFIYRINKLFVDDGKTASR